MIGTVIMIVAIIIFAVLPTLKDRITSVRKLIITPAIFIVLFCKSVIENFSLDTTSIYVILLGTCLGIAIGVLIRRKTEIKADRDQQLIWLPGSYLSLVIFTLIFTVHFVIGYLQATNPVYLTQASTKQVLLFLLAFTSNISLGASLCLYYKYRVSSLLALSTNKI
jgi:hypothetical protein